MGSSAVRTLRLSLVPMTYPARRVTRPFAVGGTKGMLPRTGCVRIASECRADISFYLPLVTSSRIRDTRKESPKKYQRSITCAMRVALEMISQQTNGKSAQPLQPMMAVFIGMNSMRLLCISEVKYQLTFPVTLASTIIRVALTAEGLAMGTTTARLVGPTLV
jgi:hypothetical protein